MAKTVMVVLLSKRRESAVEVQRVLTEAGCIIRTRLGIHHDVLDQCSNEGLIILELAGPKEEIAAFERKLDGIQGVATRLVELSLEDNP